MSIENPTLAHFRHFSSLFTLSLLYICRESSTNRPFLCKTNPILSAVGGLQMNVSNIIIRNYTIFIPLAEQKNKPNSNPIKPNLRKSKINVNLYVIEDYRKKDDFIVRINKPNFQNAQNERKLNFNKGLQKKLCFSVQKTNPIKPNSNLVLSAVEWANFERPKSLTKKSGHTPAHRDLTAPFTRNHLFGIM